MEKKISIGLEIHINLKEKIFSCVETCQKGIKPNSQVGLWELGYLGTLPLLNPNCIELALKLALVSQMKVNHLIIFDRKIYNYYDLPKGYQITQYRKPLANDGFLPIITPFGIKNIPLKSIQLEEDTAKSFYTDQGIELDFNRSGNPLIELVTDPIFHDTDEVINFVRQLQNLLRYLDISEAKMEKGQLRMDLNFSLNLANDYQTPRYEVKNLNSLSNVVKAIQCEIIKHQQLFKKKLAPPTSQTLGFDEKKQTTFSQREKTDYFYLPEANIPPIEIKAKDLQRIAKKIPILPWNRWEKLIEGGMDNLTANLIIEKALLLKTIDFLQKKQKISDFQIKDWAAFFLNYINPLFGDEDFLLFQKRYQSYFRLFQLFKEKKLEQKEVKIISEKLHTSKLSLASLRRKYQKVKISINQKQVFQLLKELWNEDLKQKHYLNPQKVQNYLLGQIKKQFPQLDMTKVNDLVNEFINKV